MQQIIAVTERGRENGHGRNSTNHIGFRGILRKSEMKFLDGTGCFCVISKEMVGIYSDKVEIGLQSWTSYGNMTL